MCSHMLYHRVSSTLCKSKNKQITEKQLRHLAFSLRFHRDVSPSLLLKLTIASSQIKAAMWSVASKCGQYIVKANVLLTLSFLHKCHVVCKICSYAHYELLAQLRSESNNTSYNSLQVTWQQQN